MAESSSLRTAATSDLAKVIRWVTSAEETDIWSGGPVSFPVEFDACRVAIGWDTFSNRALFDQGRVAGFGQIIDKPDRRKHLARIIVDPTSRGRGLGRKLVEGLMAEARGTGARCMSLNVHPGNEAAIRLYSSLGFAAAVDPDPNRTGRFTYMECPA